MESVLQPLFKPTFKLLRREKKNRRIKRVYEKTPRTGHQRLLECADVPEARKTELGALHAKLDPFELKKNIEIKLRKFFTALGNLNREATKLN
jgi:hypothetical protein